MPASILSPCLLAALSLLAFCASVLADITTATSLSSQLPSIGYPGIAYSWVFSPDTFTSDKQGASISYDVQGLPSWAHFDEAARQFTGQPGDQDLGQSRVTVTASESGGGKTQDSFQLMVIDGQPPQLNKPLVQQLPKASSLGAANILADGRQHVPLGWSFSIGFAGDTFTSSDGNEVYLAASLPGGKPLPSWLHFNADAWNFWGVAPTQPGPEGAQFDVIVTGSDRAGYGGPTTSFTLLVSAHALTLPRPLKSANVSVGDSFRYVVPTTALQLDGRQSPPSNTITVSANVAEYPWLAFDAPTMALSGVPPWNATNNDTTAIQVPITFTDTYQNNVPANLTVNVYASVFTGETLPNFIVEPGVSFNTSLAQYIRPQQGKQANVTATFDPTAASQWLSLDQNSLLLAGRPPMEPELDRVKVQLRATTQPYNLTSHTSFLLALQGDKTDQPSNDRNHGGLSNKGKVALAASLGTAGGLVLLILLMICCRRCCAVEDHDQMGRMRHESPQDDDKTLASGKSPMIGYPGESPASSKWRRIKEKEHASPYLTAGGNKSSVAWDGAPVDFAQLENVTFGEHGSPHMGDALHAYRQAEAVAMAGEAHREKPRRSGFMKAFDRGRKQPKSNSNLVRDATVNNATQSGLPVGLGIGDNRGGGTEFTRDGSYMHHSRSTRTVASWEREDGGIWYPTEDRSGSRSPSANGSVHSQGYDSASTLTRTPPSIPQRRGSHRTSPMRHRNAHINESPAFNTTAIFQTTSASGDGGSSLSQGSSNRDRFVEGDSPVEPEPEQDADMEDPAAQIVTTAHRVNVRQIPGNSPRAVDMSSIPTRSVAAHQPTIAESQRNVSSHVEAGNLSDAFEDAEVQPEYNEPPQVPRPRGARDSGMSYQVNHNAPGAVESGIFYPEPDGNLRMVHGSATSLRPEETMRAIERSATPQPPTPLFPSAFAAKSRPGTGSSAGRNAERIQHERGAPGSLLRISAMPNNPPPMQNGPPGSPGKRSGRRVTYMPQLDVPSDPSLHGTWPDWLDWLKWDPRMYELSGTVPANFQSPCDIPIVVVARSPAPPSPALPGSPGKRPNVHSKTASTDSTTTAVEDEVVTRIVLRIDPKLAAGQETDLHRAGARLVRY